MDVRIEFYPDYSQDMEKDSSKGPVRRELEDLKKLYPTVFAMVKTIFTNLENGESSIEELVKTEIFGKLSNTNGCTLWEFRIPPKGRSGVFRAYCSKNEEDAGGEKKLVITIYSAEIKKNFKAKADPEKINQACQRYKTHHQ